MSPHPSVPEPPGQPPAPPRSPLNGHSRRAFLASASAGLGLLALGTVPVTADAAEPRFIEDAFAGLAAFVLPGNDAYSKQQKKTFPGPGGVAAGGGVVTRESLDIYVPIQVGEKILPAPGALGYAIILKTITLSVDPLAVFGPFANPFANLTWTKKRTVLERLEDLPILNGSTIGFSANALTTIAGLGVYSERSSFDPRTRQLTGRPVAWDYSNYGGRSDGWPEFIGYLDGVTEVPNP
ncbi:MAG: hypothetical protein Q7T55_16865 [Solirubrobacteraceae bacterium]|nr:hypothetical protein [Solirubrobacteraceae bacterium]